MNFLDAILWPVSFLLALVAIIWLLLGWILIPWLAANLVGFPGIPLGLFVWWIGALVVGWSRRY